MEYRLIAPAALLGRRAGRALLAACVFVLASCSSPFWKQEEIPAGTVIVDIAGSLAAGRTAVVNFENQVTSVEITITDGSGTVHSAVIERDTETNEISSTKQFQGLETGNCSIALTVKINGTKIGSGSTSFTLGTSTGTTVSVPITYTQAGSGSVVLKLSTDNTEVQGISCEWINTGSFNPQTNPTVNGSASSFTISANDVPSGDHTLKIIFKDAANNTLGFITEVIQVRDGVTTDRWTSTDNTNTELIVTRAVTPAELVSSSTSADITITGLVERSGADFTYTKTLGSDWTTPESPLLCPSGTISIAITPGIPGQRISWEWGNNSTTKTTLEIEEGQNSHDLVVKVTAPNDETSSSYTITVHKAFTVRFMLLALGGATATINPTMAVVASGATAEIPATDVDDGTALQIEWNSSPSFNANTAWDFSNNTITQDTTLYTAVYPTVDVVIPEGTYSSADFENLFTNNLEKTFHLLGDVNINNSWSTSLGDFTGTFRGYGHTITLNEGSSASLFGTNTGTIQDLDIVIPAEKTATGDSIFVYTNDWDGNISHCRVQGNISRSFANCGGFAYNNNGTLNACHASGTLIIENSGSTLEYIGGLVSKNEGTISFSSSAINIDITGGNSAYIGGLVGYNYGSIAQSSSSGSIDISVSYASNIGGLVGTKSKSGTISDSFSSSTITVTVSGSTNTVDIGGLAGRVALVGTDNIQIENCSTLGSVTVVNNGSANIERVGGFIGHIDTTNEAYKAPLQITNCFASNSVSIDNKATSVGGFIGGIVTTYGTADTRTLENCYAIGNIDTGTTGKNVGGFIGSMSGTYSPSISNCYARGDVTGGVNTGGFIGNFASGNTSNCYTSGIVSPQDEQWGGFVGESSGTISNCYFENKYTSYEGNNFGEIKNTTEMKSIETFRDDYWSISETLGASTTWGIDTTGTINDGYPYLQCFGAATVTP